MSSFSTEVTSSKIASDNPLYQRTFKAYKIVANKVNGHTLEVGCGEGYGIPYYINNTTSLTLVDKSKSNLNSIKNTHKDCIIHAKKIPPLEHLQDNTFDTVISFQVIEHIKDYKHFLKEIHRVLKPTGKAYISTPNKAKTIARNPWHYKEFNFEELELLLQPIFSKYEILGIEGNAKTNQYYSKNKASVERILALDVLKLHNSLPNPLLKIPYEILNRINRKRLLKNNNTLTKNINVNDYSLNTYNKNTLDFFCVLEK